MFYVIDQERLVNEVNLNLKKGRGQLDWFVSSEGLLNILINVEGTKYIYREPIQTAKENAVIMSFLDSRKTILGAVHEDEIYKKKIIPPKTEVTNAKL